MILQRSKLFIQLLQQILRIDHSFSLSVRHTAMIIVLFLWKDVFPHMIEFVNFCVESIEKTVGHSSMELLDLLRTVFWLRLVSLQDDICCFFFLFIQCQLLLDYGAYACLQFLLGFFNSRCLPFGLLNLLFTPD